MSENGQNVLGMVRQMQKLYGEIGAFMKHFEMVIAKKSLKPISNSTSVIKDISQSLNLPEQWGPMWMYRLYQGNIKHELVSLNIALDCPDYQDRITEPLALFSIVSGKKADMKHEWYPWDIYFSFRPLQKQNNRVYSLKDFDLKNIDGINELVWEKGDLEAIEELRFISVPLMEIEGEQDILNKIVNPILN